MPNTPPTNGQRKLRYIELFAGIGGFGLALNRLGHECVYANEWDKYAAQIYEKNFKQKPDTRDIAIVPISNIPEHDLLVGGFPCQTFSVAGKRRGFEDTRGTMFFEICRIIKAKKTKILLLENVKGLTNHDGGKTFYTIISTLDELGYDCQWQVLNSRYFGVPQNRERIFIIANLRGESRPQVFPIIGNNRKNNEQVQIASTAIDANYFKGADKHAQRTMIMRLDTNERIQDRVYSATGISPSLSTRSGGRTETKIIHRAPIKFLGRNQKNINGDYSFTVDTLNTNGVRVENKIRKLTPVECERLQGFPDGWTEGVSDTQRYKQLGNAVTVNVVYEVAKRL